MSDTRRFPLSTRTTIELENCTTMPLSLLDSLRTHAQTKFAAYFSIFKEVFFNFPVCNKFQLRTSLVSVYIFNIWVGKACLILFYHDLANCNLLTLMSPIRTHFYYPRTLSSNIYFKCFYTLRFNAISTVILNYHIHSHSD